ncbi:hypothetical protein AV654_10520 [Paenibacillus elgii]|uniref:Uncharacterized protein n=1 Tax=Paenibacillus elgii TaxID=189691 RepID=A0A163Z188_9BACL|nr:hypothetical protein [Paenibacillus elgii]KZE80783.1 hypothetical protein AV654_10520 [Paenibacillus elgii]
MRKIATLALLSALALSSIAPAAYAKSSCSDYDELIKVSVNTLGGPVFGDTGTIEPVDGWKDIFDLKVKHHETYDSAQVKGVAVGTGCVVSKHNGSKYYYKIKVTN